MVICGGWLFQAVSQAVSQALSRPLAGETQAARYQSIIFSASST
jgi:hypothetical protein